MSSRLQFNDDILIAEYTLGVLDPDDLARAHAVLSENDDAVALALDWEHRLLDLVDILPPASTPPELWLQIQSAIGHDDRPSPLAQQNAAFQTPAASRSEKSSRATRDARTTTSVGSRHSNRRDASHEAITSRPKASPSDFPESSQRFLVRPDAAAIPSSDPIDSPARKEPRVSAGSTPTTTDPHVSAQPSSLKLEGDSAQSSSAKLEPRLPADTSSSGSGSRISVDSSPTSSTHSVSAERTFTRSTDDQASSAHRPRKNDAPELGTDPAVASTQAPDFKTPRHHARDDRDERPAGWRAETTADAAAAPSSARRGSAARGATNPLARWTWSNLWFWRLVCVVLAAFTIVTVFGTGASKSPAALAAPLFPTAEPAPVVSQVAVLQAPGNTSTPGWLLTVDSRQRVSLNPMVDVELPETSSLYLWTYNDLERQPRLLGVVDSEQPLSLPADVVGPVRPGQIFEMTQEPNQQPPYQPDGPILFIGRTVALTP